MIVTQRQRVPWSWVVVMALPFFANNYVELCSNAPMTFTLKKHTDNFMLITFVLSFNVAFNFLVAPFVAYHSDRIWTRLGRRKPFILLGWLGLSASLILMPMAPNLWTLVLIILFYQLFEDMAFTGPWQPLYYEVVPPKQRGRGAALNHAMQGLMGLVMNFALIGQFDNIYRLGETGFQLTGEHVIYWLAAAAVLIMLCVIMFGIKETPPAPGTMPPREPFSLVQFVKGIFGQRQWLMVYMLIFAQIALNAGMAQIEPLLLTEQFGYPKKMFGHVNGYAYLFQLAFCLPVIGFLADRMDRLRLFQIGLTLNVLRHLAYWSFIHFVAEDQIPAPHVIQTFSFISTIVHVFGNVCMGPLLFDYIPRDKMGTIHAGMSFVRGIVRLVINWGVGIWVTVYSFFLLPDGKYDYSSALLYLCGLGTFGLLFSMYFRKMKNEGKIIEYGRMAPVAQQPAPEPESRPALTGK